MKFSGIDKTELNGRARYVPLIRWTETTFRVALTAQPLVQLVAVHEMFERRHKVVRQQ